MWNKLVQGEAIYHFELNLTEMDMKVMRYYELSSYI